MYIDENSVNLKNICLTRVFLHFFISLQWRMQDLTAQVTSSLLQFPEVTIQALGEDEITLDSVLRGKFSGGEHYPLKCYCCTKSLFSGGYLKHRVIESTALDWFYWDASGLEKIKKMSWLFKMLILEWTLKSQQSSLKAEIILCY